MKFQVGDYVRVGTGENFGQVIGFAAMSSEDVWMLVALNRNSAGWVRNANGDNELYVSTLVVHPDSAVRA